MCCSSRSRRMRITWPLAALLLIPCAIAQAQPVESFYRGKSINLIIGYPPAGANDVYARMVARHLGRHIPGNPTIVPRNLPGAGSLLAASRIFNTEPKDGTTLGLLVPTIPLDEKLENPAAKYRAADFNWIGRMAPAPNVTFIMATSAVKTIGDAFDKVAVLGATGRSATNSIYPTVLNNVLGTRFKIVNGYEGSAAAMIAMERGEVEGHSSTYDSVKAVHPDWITDKRVNIVVQYSLRRHPSLPSSDHSRLAQRGSAAFSLRSRAPPRSASSFSRRLVLADRVGAAPRVRRHGQG